MHLSYSIILFSLGFMYNELHSPHVCVCATVLFFEHAHELRFTLGYIARLLILLRQKIGFHFDYYNRTLRFVPTNMTINTSGFVNCILFVPIWFAVIMTFGFRFCLRPLHLPHIREYVVRHQYQTMGSQNGSVFLGPKLCTWKGEGQQWAFTFSGLQFRIQKRTLFKRYF